MSNQADVPEDPIVKKPETDELSTEELAEVAGGTRKLTSDPCEGGEFRAK
jgi:hypothetical protein